MTRRVVGTWIAGALRRPARALVVVVTLAAMTVGVVAALVAGDALDGLFVADARSEWGDVDVVVTSGRGPFLPEGLARFIAMEMEPHVRAGIPRMFLPGVAAHREAREPDVQVIGVGPEETLAAVPLRAVEGTAAITELPRGAVVLNERLASRLGASVGDEVTVVVGVPRHEVDDPERSRTRTVDGRAVTVTASVAGVVANEGLADLHRRPAVLFRRSALQELTGLAGEVTALHLLRDDPRPAVADDIVRVLEPTLRRLGLAARTVGLDALEIADDEAGQFRSILLILAAVVVAAASVAAVQLLTALTQDRSGEIAQLRVHGVPARGIGRLVGAEAAVYAVVGGALGAIAALPLAGWIARLLADHFADLSAGRGREQVPLDPTVDPVTVVIGVLIVVVAAVLAGRSAGQRLSIVEVGTLLRGPVTTLPAPALRDRRTVVIALVGSLSLGMGIGGGVATDALRYLGVTLLLLAWWMYTRRRVDGVAARHAIDRRGAWAGLAWATIGAAALADFSQGYETGFGVLFVAGVVSVVSATILVAGRFRGLVRGLRAYVPLGPWQAVLRTAGAQAEASAGRTARLHATFGIVLFAAAALQVLGSAQDIDPDRQSGGFDIIGTSVVGVDPAVVGATPGVAHVLSLRAGWVPEDRYAVVDDDDTAYRVRYPVRLVETTSDVAALQSFRLVEAVPEFTTAADALDAVVRDGDKVVIDRRARPPGASVGDDVVLDVGAGPRSYRLVAVLDTFLLGSVFVSEAEFPQLVSTTGATFVLATAAPGVAAIDLAERLEDAGADVGLSVRTVAQVTDDVVAVNRTFTDVFALMLLIGLGVALLAVAATIVRGAREHRGDLALLWAHGLRRHHLAAVLAVEPAIVAGTGGVLGLAVGLAVLRALFATGFADLPFVLDWGRLGAIITLLALALVATCTVVAAIVTPRTPAEGLQGAR